MAAALAAALLASVAARAVDCQPQTLSGFAVTVCRVELARERLVLYRANARGEAYGSFAALRQALAAKGRVLRFAMNAGMYEPDRSPVGLFVAGGRELAPLNQRSGAGNFYQQPNGVLLWDRHRAQVLATGDYATQRPRPLYATQSGPLLVHEGQITTAPFMNPQSTSRKIRNGACAPSPLQLLFVITEQPLTLFEFAGVFKDALGCSEALYLDGHVSGLYYPPLQRDDNHDRLGPIVGVSEAAR